MDPPEVEKSSARDDREIARTEFPQQMANVGQGPGGPIYIGPSDGRDVSAPTEASRMCDTWQLSGGLRIRRAPSQDGRTAHIKCRVLRPTTFDTRHAGARFRIYVPAPIRIPDGTPDSGPHSRDRRRISGRLTPYRPAPDLLTPTQRLTTTGRGV